MNCLFTIIFVFKLRGEYPNDYRVNMLLFHKCNAHFVLFKPLGEVIKRRSDFGSHREDGLPPDTQSIGSGGK